ncbi:MAG: hypothetical protein WBC01_11525 [Solirubrobacterales bacterium]
MVDEVLAGAALLVGMALAGEGEGALDRLAVELLPGLGGVLTDDSEEVAQQSTLLLAQSPRDLVDWCGRRSVDMVNSDPGVAVGVELGELSAGRVLELTLAGR